MGELITKATLDEVNDAIRGLDNERKAMTSVQGCIDYRNAANKVFVKMGWTRDEFIDTLTAQIIESRDNE